jgi:hypothetical protein
MTRLTPRRQDRKNLGLEELRLARLRLRWANHCPHPEPLQSRPSAIKPRMTFLDILVKEIWCAIQPEKREIRPEKPILRPDHGGMAMIPVGPSIF